MNTTEKLDKIDLKYIEQFLINGTIKEPTESMMIPTDSLAELTDLIKQNRTHCFKIEPGLAGWCATCRVRPRKNIFPFLQNNCRLRPRRVNMAFVNPCREIGDQKTLRKLLLLPLPRFEIQTTPVSGNSDLLCRAGGSVTTPASSDLSTATTSGWSGSPRSRMGSARKVARIIISS